MRQDTAPQLATRLRSYTIGWDTGPRAVYTCQQSLFLADRQHQQVNRTGTSAFSRCAGQLYSGKGKEASGGRDIIIRRDGKTEGGARPILNGHACFPQEIADCTHGRTMEGVLDLCNGEVSEKTPQKF